MKKLLSIILASLIIFSSFATAASAAGDSISAATSISLNKTYSGSITSSSTIDYYKFTLSNSGRINLKMSAGIQYAYFYIYDASGNQVWNTGGISWNSTTELIVLNKNIDLTSGTYYFCVKQGLSYTGNYSFSLNYTSANETFKETQGGSNNKTSTADSISLGTKYYGQIASNDKKDFYKFKVSSSGSVTLTVSASIQYSFYYIYDSSANEVWRSGGMTWNYSTELLSMTKTITLSAGTYYFAVAQGNSDTGNYNFKITGPSGSSGSNDSSVSLSLSDTSVKVEKGSSVKVNCSYSGTHSNGVKISYSIGNKEYVSCSWGDWSNKKIPVTISGLAEGSTTVKISLKDSSTNEVLDSETISVEVVPEGSGNSTGGGTSSGGFSIFSLIFYLFALILSILF